MLALHKAPIRRWVALLFAAGMLAACQEDAVDPVSEAEAKLHAAPRPAKIFTVTDQIGLLERRFAGRVAAVKTVDLSFQVPGKLVALPVLESQRVKEGDLIATLDTTDYDRAVREATINAEQAKRELDRLETLRERSVISQSAYDEQKNKHDLALETLKEAKQNLEYTTLKAPSTGSSPYDWSTISPRSVSAHRLCGFTMCRKCRWTSTLPRRCSDGYPSLKWPRSRQGSRPMATSCFR